MSSEVTESTGSNNISLFKDGRHKVFESQLVNYTAMFGGLFTEMTIEKNGKTVPVPVRFANGPTRRKGDPKLEGSIPKAKDVFPMISYTLTDFSRNNERKTMIKASVSNRNLSTHEQSVQTKTSLAPIPYDITYTLTIRSNTLTDTTLIFEQINSAFIANVNVRMVDNKILDIVRTVNIKMTERTEFQDNYQEIDATRFVDIDVTFIVEGFLYQVPVDVPVILEYNSALTQTALITLDVDQDELKGRLLKFDVEQAFAQGED